MPFPVMVVMVAGVAGGRGRGTTIAGEGGLRGGLR